MARTKTQTYIYWVDLYRCEDPDYDTWDVDSYIAVFEAPKDKLPALGWSVHGVRQFVPSDFEGYYPIIQRIRGGIIVPQGTRPVSYEDLLLEYRLTISHRPTPDFDINCGYIPSSEGSEPHYSEMPTASTIPQPLSSSWTFEESSSLTPCAMLGCMDALLTPVSAIGVSELDASSSFEASASAECELQDRVLCDTQATATYTVGPFWVVEGFACCTPAAAYVDLELTLDINGTTSTDTPADNPYPVDQTIVLEGMSFTYPGIGPLNAIVFDSLYPKRACLVGGVSTLEVEGVFGGGTATRTMLYNPAASDITYGGRAAFINPIAGDLSCYLVTKITLTIDDCTESSSG